MLSQRAPSHCSSRQLTNATPPKACWEFRVQSVINNCGSFSSFRKTSVAGRCQPANGRHTSHYQRSSLRSGGGEGRWLEAGESRGRGSWKRWWEEGEAASSCFMRRPILVFKRGALKAAPPLSLPSTRCDLSPDHEAVSSGAHGALRLLLSHNPLLLPHTLPPLVSILLLWKL